MIVFDLREEARLVSYFLYLMGPATLALGIAAVVPRVWRDRLPPALGEALRPLALIFAATTAFLVWAENDERKTADALVEQCLTGGCTLVEGRVDSVDPVRQIAAADRWTLAIYAGYFAVGDSYFAHYPRDFSNYSPANRLREGDRVRVFSHDDVLVLVEVVQ